MINTFKIISIITLLNNQYLENLRKNHAQILSLPKHVPEYNKINCTVNNLHIIS